MDPSVSAAIVQEELARAEHLANTYNWRLKFDPQSLLLHGTLSAPDEEEYLLETLFDDYREIPPHLDFVDPDTGVRGTPAAYPRSTGGGESSIFIESNNRPIICLPCSRLAYNQLQGPHAWPYANWDQTAPRYPTIADMLLRIQTELSERKGYQGRWAARIATNTSSG